MPILHVAFGMEHPMVKWAWSWEMLFNVEKCKVLQVGRMNRRYRYWSAAEWLAAAGEGPVTQRQYMVSGTLAQPIPIAMAVLK